MDRLTAREILRLVRTGLRPITAARLAGSTPANLEDLVSTNEKFARLLANAVEEAVDRIEDSLIRKALSGDVRAQLAVLTCRRPDRWRPADDQSQEGGEVWQRLADALQRRIEQQQQQPQQQQDPQPAPETTQCQPPPPQLDAGTTPPAPG